MNKVIIYKPQKSPTQSGKRNTSQWIMESDAKVFKETDPLTGWKLDSNYKALVKLKFNNLDDALNYAKKNEYDYRVIEDVQKDLKIRSYSDNFKHKRVKTEI
tara:strand:- start:19 stop:324 length:306 start_codon:yes stop_codon:yes gene_type:complete